MHTIYKKHQSYTGLFVGGISGIFAFLFSYSVFSLSSPSIQHGSMVSTYAAFIALVLAGTCAVFVHWVVAGVSMKRTW